ncbi:MAG: hypothetical protein ACHQ2Y_06850 [Candidatus Lutacidiplasmatales archaeon]
MSTQPRPSPRLRVILAVSVTVLGLALPSMTAAASPAPTGAGPTAASISPFLQSQSWAYGGQRWVNATPNTGNATITIHGYFGWDVVFTAVNTSASTVSLEAQRVMGASLFEQFCSPSCSAPTRSANVTVVGWESDAAFTNLSYLASVDVNGIAVPAVGVVNASASTSGGINESFSFSQHMPMGLRSASANLHVTGQADEALTFSPVLGVLPTTLTPGESWNSSSVGTAVGSASGTYAFASRGPMGGNASGRGSPSYNVTGRGNVSVSGNDLGTITLGSGATVPQLSIQSSGPFDLVDGVFFLPHSYNLFGPVKHEWDGREVGALSVATSRLDVAFDATQRGLRIVAAASSYGSNSSSLPSEARPTSGGTVGESASPASGPGVLVQAQPESVPQAQQNQQCLLGRCNAAPGASGARPLASLIAGGLLVGLIVLTVGSAAAVVAARRRVPVEPSSPNASLYPTGAARAPSPPVARTAPGQTAPPPPDEPDPLGHLW